MLLLNRAYQSRDLSLVYPFARGVAPLVVATVLVTALGEKLTYFNQAAIVLIGLGIYELGINPEADQLD